MIEQLINKHIGLLKLKDASWHHFSCSPNRIIIRDFRSEPPDTKGNSYERSEINGALSKLLNGGSQPLSMAEIAKLGPDVDFPIHRLSVMDASDWPKWRILIEQLNEIPNREPLHPPYEKAIQEREALVIPQTRLRRFYETLRLFGARDIHGAFAGYESAARRIDHLFNESVRHFSCYEVPQMYAPFYGNDHRNWNNAYLDAPKEFAKCLQARLKPATAPNPKIIHKVGENPDLKFYTVDYEVSPRRTPGNAVFEDGHAGRSSGAGGMDLLLGCETDNTPIVAEIKAEDDTNVFLALVQSLVYASELVTVHQWKRLQRAYSLFAGAPRPQVLDIYIISQPGDRPQFIDETMVIANELMNPGCHVSEHVRRIAFITAELVADSHGVIFSSHHLARSLAPAEAVPK